MIFPEIASFLFNGTKDFDKNDTLKIFFISEFQKDFEDKKDFFERLTPAQLARIPSFMEFCQDDHLVPNSTAVKNYITELKSKFIDNPDLLKTREKGAYRNYKNESLSSSDLADFEDKPTVAQIEVRVRSKKDFIERDDRIELSSQGRMNQASRAWNKVVAETRKSNKDEIKSKDVKAKLIKKTMTLMKCKSPEEAERLVDFTIQMMQRHSSILVNFPTNFLSDEQLQKHRLMNAFEGAGTRDSDYIASREREEDKLVSHTTEKTKQKLKQNVSARPRYGQLLLFGSNQIPSSNQHGDSYMILDEKLKLESTFTLGDTLNAQNLRLSTIENFELMLFDASKTDFINIFRWAVNGTALDNIRGEGEYIEAQMPVIDILDTNSVKSIHVNSDTKELDQKTLDGFESIGLAIDNKDSDYTYKIRDAFFHLIKDPKADPKEVKKIIERYVYLPKLRDKDGVTMLEIAAKSGNVAVLNILVKELTGRNIEEWKGRDLGEYEKHMFCKVMYAAAQNSNKEVLKVLSKNLNISDLRDIHSNTPLMLAMLDRNEDAGKNLILQGDDPNSIPRHFIVKHTKDGHFKKMLKDYDSLKESTEKKFALVLKEVKKGASPEEAIKKYFPQNVDTENLFSQGIKSNNLDIDLQNIKLSFVEKFVTSLPAQDKKLSNLIIESLATNPTFIKLLESQTHVEKVSEKNSDISKSK